MTKFICKILIRIMGFKTVGGVIPEPKVIVLGIPHTSNWDFILSFIYYRAVGGKSNTMVKKEFFFWPLGYLVRWMGGIPVDRSKGASLVKQVLAEFDRREIMHLAIAPEGTRQPVAKWKGGFHTIARAANIPVYLAFFDWGRRRIGYEVKIELTDDLQADLKKIRQWYKDNGIVGKHPERMNYGNDLD